MSAVLTNSMASHSCDAMLILGVTPSGNIFRPSDWVDRLAGQFSTFCKDKRLKYSSSVSPVIIEETRGLLVDISLLESNPAAFRFLLDFAADNNLTIRCLKDSPREDSPPDGVISLRDIGSQTTSAQ